MIRPAIFILISTCLLAACSSDRLHHEIWQVLEEALEAEADFEASQARLLELEREEVDLYQGIMQLGADEVDELEGFLQQAFKNIEERSLELESERAAILSSKRIFMQLESQIKKVKEKEIQSVLEKMYGKMMQRYEQYEKVYERYKESLDLTEVLYYLLEGEEGQRALTDALEASNESYEDLFAVNEMFNVFTKSYNQLKREYYESVWQE